MQAQVVLIIDSRNELSHKYKKIIMQDSYIHPVISVEIQEAFDKMRELEPDLIIISENISENITDLCKKIREFTNFYRPVLVVLSKSSYLEDKLQALKAGADDYLSEPIDPSEFSLRIFAHLRRHVEELSNPVTKLPSVGMTSRVIKRIINSDGEWALLYLSVDNLNLYSEIYGHIASEKLLKAYGALLKTAIAQGDFAGHIKDNDFIILTSPQKADRIATYVNYAFDSISSGFYSDEDVERGYLIINGDEKAGMRAPFVSISTGIISNEYRTYTNYQEVMNSVTSTHKLAKSQAGSSWISDRPQICTDGSCVRQYANSQKKILILETDAALAYLLTTTLEMQGYIVESTDNQSEAVNIIEKTLPDIVLLDFNEIDAEENFDICRKIKSNRELSNIKIIISTVIHDKEKVLNSGADLYLPKPYELISLFGWISKFLNQQYI